MPAVRTGKRNAIPPKQPTEADIELLSVAQSAELAVRDLYRAALISGGFSDVQQSVLELFRDHHTAYVQALNGFLGKSATSNRNESLFASFADQVRSTATAFSALQSLENILVATHTDVVGSLIGLDGANLMASILVIEARHAAIFGSTPDMNIDAALSDSAESLLTSDTAGG